MLIFGKASDADARARDQLAADENTAVIPFKENRKLPPDFDRQTYKARHWIDKFFAKIKQFRATATEYNIAARNSNAAAQLVAAVIWFNWRHILI